MGTVKYQLVRGFINLFVRKKEEKEKEKPSTRIGLLFLPTPE
jgi:hypothetical protein